MKFLRYTQWKRLNNVFDPNVIGSWLTWVSFTWAELVRPDLRMVSSLIQIITIFGMLLFCVIPNFYISTIINIIYGTQNVNDIMYEFAFNGLRIVVTFDNLRWKSLRASAIITNFIIKKIIQIIFTFNFGLNLKLLCV